MDSVKVSEVDIPIEKMSENPKSAPMVEEYSEVLDVVMAIVCPSLTPVATIWLPSAGRVYDSMPASATHESSVHLDRLKRWSAVRDALLVLVISEVTGPS